MGKEVRKGDLQHCFVERDPNISCIMLSLSSATIASDLTYLRSVESASIFNAV